MEGVRGVKRLEIDKLQAIPYTPILTCFTPPPSMHLKPLRRHLEEMEECDFLELEQRFRPMFHIICLVWANSKHYCQPARLIVLLQEISNLVLDLVSSCMLTSVILIYLLLIIEYIDP